MMVRRTEANGAANAAGDERADVASWLGGWTAAAIYFGLALIYFLPAFLPGRHIFGTDYLAGAFFAHDFISQRFAAWAMPKWDPFLYGGVPMFANPGSAFYPFRFLADLVFPVSRIFPAMYVIQFTLAGMGAFALSRELGARRWVAFIAGLAFEFTGLTMSFVFAGHEGRIIVATFAPLFLFFLHRGVRTGSPVSFAGMGAVLGFSLLSFQIQSNYYLLLAGAAWAVFALVRQRRRASRGALVARAAMGLAAVGLAFGMAAVNFLPFAGYVDASPRGGPGRGYEYATSWSMPPAELSGLALPERAGILENYRGENPFKLHTEYVGAVIVLLTLVGAWVSRRDPFWWFFLGLTVFALTISFGGYTPIYRLYYDVLPGTSKFRAPSIAFFLVSTSLVMMAALTLERLAALRDDSAREPADAVHAVPWILAGASALALIVLLSAAGGGAGDARASALAGGAFRVAIVTWLASGALWLWLRASIPSGAVAAALAVLVVVDLWVVDRHFFETVAPPSSMFAADGVVRTLAAEPGPFRVWALPISVGNAPPYRNNTNYLMYHGIEQAGGEHGNQLQRYNEFVGAGETSYVDWHNFLADLQRLIQAPGGAASARANFLRAANVRYIVSTAGIPGLPVVYQGPEADVYEVPGALPRAWLAGAVVVATEPGEALRLFDDSTFDPARTAVLAEPLGTPLPESPLEGAARVIEHHPDRVRITTEASRRALLVLADNYYPGWKATVDGAEVPVHLVDHTFRGVVVPEGDHEVDFVFHPSALYTGVVVTLVSAFLLLLATAVPPLWRRRRV